MSKISKEVTDKVVFVGPDIKEAGGMAAVLRNYRSMLPSFHYIQTNSRHGTMRGVIHLAAAFAQLPWQRVRGRRIMHVHGCSGKSFVRKGMLMRWGRMLGFRVVFHCHGGGIRQYFETIGKDKAVSTLRHCHAIVTLSRVWQEYFMDTFHRTDVYELNNVVLPAVASHSGNDGCLRLLFLGAINDNKGIFDLVETIRANAERWRGRIKLTIGGGGETPRLLQAINGLEDLIRYAGVISGPEKDRIVADSDVAVLPSYIEGLPMFILESMAVGMPVISTPVGGIPSIVENGVNGILFPPGNHQALAEAIDTYLENPQIMAAHAAESLSRIAPYLPAHITERLSEIYQNL